MTNCDRNKKDPQDKPGQGSKLLVLSAGRYIGRMLMTNTGMANDSDDQNACFHTWFSLVFARDSSCCRPSLTPRHCICLPWWSNLEMTHLFPSRKRHLFFVRRCWRSSLSWRRACSSRSCFSLCPCSPLKVVRGSLFSAVRFSNKSSIAATCCSKR